MSACQPMNSVVSSAWNRRHASSYCGCAFPSGRHRSAQVESRWRPVDEAPFAVEGLHVAVLMAQPVDELLEHALVVEDLEARLVVDLEADHGRVVGVARQDLADDPLGVELERGVGVVDLLPSAPVDALAGAVLAGDLGVEAHEPRRDGVRRGAEDDGDAALVRAVEDRLEPVEFELPVLGLPSAPDGFAHADHREARLDHEVEVGLQPRTGGLGVESFNGVRLVLEVIRGPEQDRVRPVAHLRLLLTT